METEEINEEICMPASSFLSGVELVALRKPEELAPQLNIGLKFSECSNTEAEREAVDSALDTQKTILAQKRGARICDLMQADWNEELNVALTTKLKGKFVQHMGHKIDDKIALTPEESIFLLENGCLEIKNGKAPMSTEEAYAAMLKQKLSVEKYIVYSYLSQLGFIVVPHKKEFKSKLQKVAAVERNKKRKIHSPLPEEIKSKRLTFSGVFSEEKKSDRTLDTEEVNKSLLNDIAIISDGATTSSAKAEVVVCEEKKSERTLNTEKVNKSLLNDIAMISEGATTSSAKAEVVVCEESEKTDADSQLQSECSEIIPSSPCNNLENSKTDVEIELNVDESSSVKPSISASAPDMDIDSQSTDVLLDSLEKSTGVFVADAEERINIEDTIQSSDSQCAVINDVSDMDEENSEVLSCSSYDYDELENSENENSQENINVDDDITLVEVTKKETTPLAVIDLLSDDEEGQPGITNSQEDSESDDDIKIVDEVCNGLPSSSKKSDVSVNLRKIKSQKADSCKGEQSSSHSVQNATPRIQFPEVLRKDLLCVARPYLNLLPLYVQPAKEVYILDCSKIQLASRGHHSGAPQQPQARLWNSYRDLQDHQRSLRRDRPFNRHQNHGRPWRRICKHGGLLPRRRPPYFNNSGSPREQRNDIARPDRNFSRNGRDMDYRGPSALKNEHDSNYRSQNGSEEQKPFTPSNSSLPLNEPPRFNPSDSLPSRIPPLSHPNSLPVSHSAPNFPPLNPLDLNNPPGGVSNLTSQDFVAEVHRTAYSYATTMLSSMFGSAFNANNFSSLAPFPSIRPPFGMPQPITLIDGQNSRNLSSPFANEYYPLPNNRHLQGDFPRNRRHHRTEPFPCHYRNIQYKKSWNDVRAAVGSQKEPSDGESSDIEEIPINTNEFLWNGSNICPLIKPGIKHPLVDVLSSLKLTQLAKLTDKACRNDKCFSDNQMLEIHFDVYKPGTHFKKSCPGVPYLRIIIMRSSDPVPRYSDIAFLQRKWSDSAALQIAIVDNADVSFYSFSSICIPDIVPFQD